MSIFDQIFNFLATWGVAYLRVLLACAKIAIGFVALIMTLLWALVQVLILITEFLHWLGDNVFSAIGSSPIQAAFPAGMDSSLAFANGIFPVQECFDAFSFLAALWLLVATARIIKSVTVSILGS